VVPADSVIALDDLSVEVGNKKEESQSSKTNTARDGNGSNIPRRLLVETKVGGSLVDNGECADGTSDQEEEGSSPDRPGDRVLAKVDDHLDEHEDDGTEASRGSRSHSETSKNGTETFALVPAPLDLRGAGNSDTNTSDSRDERVGRRDVGRVLGAPHDPGGGTGESASKGQHLDTSIVLEGVGGDDAVLDGFGSTGTNSDGADHFEDGA